MNLQVDENYLLKTLTDLVHINSINPSLSTDGNGEVEIASYLADALSDLGINVTTYPLEHTRINVVGTLKGNGKGRSLLLNGHMDTVGIDGMTIDPFGGKIQDGYLYGRGSQDMKGSLAAMMTAVKALKDADIRLDGDLVFSAVADEEFASIGTEDLVRNIRTDAAIVTEPTDLKIGCAHRGFIWFEVETFGKAAHGSRFDEGVDANIRMGRFLAKLDNLEKELRMREPHPLVGPPSLHAPRIRGGAETSIYAANCLLEIERRTIPGENLQLVTAELQKIVDFLEEEDPTFKAVVNGKFERDPFEIEPDAPIIAVVEDVISRKPGLDPIITGQPFWTDAALLSEAGIDTILFGPKGGGLHSEVEWVDIQSVVDLAEILANTAVNFCN